MTDPIDTRDLGERAADKALGKDWSKKGDSFGGKIFRSSQEADAYAATIRKEHAEIAAHNEGQSGMPQGPCQCPICAPSP